ncbi:MAG TPA: MscL family protein, partial [Candidatus Binatia bacterium]|nr:MscL family protein [Candidatus Binatia bacterium]
SFINPLFVLIFPGNQTLSARTFTLHLDGRHADFGWGAVVFTIIDFVFIAIVIYAIIKLFKLDKLDKPTI